MWLGSGKDPLPAAIAAEWQAAMAAGVELREFAV